MTIRRPFAVAWRARLATFAAALPLLASTAAGAAAQCPPAALPLTPDLFQSGLRDARDHGFLWRISKNGRTSYLYGTIHAAKLEWMFPGPTVLDAVRASDTVALELDLLDADIQRRLAASVAPRRADPLPAALVRRIEQRMSAECIDAAA